MDLFEERNKLNKIGDALQFVGSISMFVYWSFVPLLCLGTIAVLYAQMTGLSIMHLFWSAGGWFVSSIFLIGLGAFFQEYKRKKVFE